MGEGVAFVTGAGRGIGRAAALALASDGYDVAIAARTGVEIDSVAAEVRARGRRSLAIALDVRDPAAITRAFADCRAELGEPAVLINNAGIAPSLKFHDITLAAWNEVLAVDLTSAFLCSQAALPAMVQQSFGRIINVASTAAKTGFKYTAAYTAAKHGLLGLTRALALEVAGKGVTVNAVCPGFTRTRISDDAVANIVKKTGRSESEAATELARLSPLGRLTEPGEVAAVIAFLARRDSAAITGQGINIDGGSVMS